MDINATLFSQMVVFISFVGLTRRYILPPIIDLIDERQAEIIRGIEEAKEATTIKNNALQEAEKIIHEARMQHAEIIQAAEEERQYILEEATKEAATLREKQIMAAQSTIKEQIKTGEKALANQTLSLVENVLHKVMVTLPDQPQLNTMIEAAIGDVHAENE